MDERTVIRAQRGDRQAFAELVRVITGLHVSCSDDLRPLLQDPWERRRVQWLDQPLPGTLEGE